MPTIYRVILGQEKFSQRMRIQGELFKLLFLTFYATLFFFQIFGAVKIYAQIYLQAPAE